jgi:hypothetical protein
METSQSQLEFIGSVFNDEFNNQHVGYTIALSVEEMHRAMKKADKNAKVRIRIRTGKSSGKPYATLLEPRELSSGATTPTAKSSVVDKSDDLPF